MSFPLAFLGMIKILVSILLTTFASLNLSVANEPPVKQVPTLSSINCYVQLKETVNIFWGPNWIVASFADTFFGKSLYVNINTNTEMFLPENTTNILFHLQKQSNVSYLPDELIISLNRDLKAGSLSIDGEYFELYSCTSLIVVPH